MCHLWVLEHSQVHRFLSIQISQRAKWVSPIRFSNSLDAVSDRDFVAEALFDLALIGTHLSRIGEEWVLWTSEEFGFATLDDRYATGSSMLPQKRTPISQNLHVVKPDASLATSLVYSPL
jgi:hypothetical protein